MGSSESRPQPLASQEGKIFVVTGANTGLGYETAKILGKAKGHVVLACRSEERGKEAAARLEKENEGVGVYEFMRMDLADLASVKEFVEEVGRRHPRVDVLINNAGVMWPPFGKTKDGFETQFGVNHLGHFALTLQMLPLLEKSSDGRVVPISSMAADWKGYAGMMWDNLNGDRGYNHHFAYGQSKLANLLFAFELDRRLRSTSSKIKVVCAHPGASSSELLRHSKLSPFISSIEMCPSQGCLSFIRAACSADVHSGEYYGPHGFIHASGWPTKVTPPVRATNQADAAKLWKLSEEMTGVRFPA
eukprot:TRINITY_DN13873_c0_g1_i1.p1 TRINITY_DN13873_c0_g1~~TRINITY_DN13873_c0_g1_i1.p1  ORF type:complete len:304 (+),score=67.67 TRINITY_DN13873_c0_g1_i1:49-960(+)